MLKVRLLGQFTVHLDDEPVAISSRPAQSLLAYLVLSPGIAHRRERLAGVFWPDVPEASARSNLRHTLWRLRKALLADASGSSFILADDLTIAFQANADYWLDVAVVARPVDPGWSGAELSRVLLLYGGELLPGLYDDWLVPERERLQAVFEYKMQLLLERLIAERRWPEVLDWGERWLALGHLPEPAFRGLMIAHSNLGDVATAAAAYRRCVEALRRELGVEPSAQTTALYERIRAGGQPVNLIEVERGTTPAPPPLGPEAPAPGVSPFKGLQYFEEADADLFFGRERLIARLVARLTLLAAAGPVVWARDSDALTWPGERMDVGRFLAVIGASGSGKSSVLRAGLIPALKHGYVPGEGVQPPVGSTRWSIHLITPTAHPLESLAVSLSRDSESVTAAATLSDDLARDPRSLRLYVQRLLDKATPAQKDAVDKAGEIQLQGLEPGLHWPEGSPRPGMLLLVVDQFEELFTLCRSQQERRAFVDNLLVAAGVSLSTRGSAENGPDVEDVPLVSSPDGSILVIIALRADFYAHCAQFDNLRSLLARQQEYIGPMQADDVRRVVEEPARRGGWELEPGLVDLLLRDVGDEPGALPLLSHALLETWRRRQGRRLSLSGYAAAGGVQGAITKSAETVFKEQLQPEQQIIARHIFLRLTELGEGTQDTRRRATLNELVPNPNFGTMTAVGTVLKTLADARLIITAAGTVEVAHEALIREWPRLRDWLDEDREQLRLHRHLTEAAQEWDRLDRDPDELYRGTRLAQSLDWAAAQPQDLSAMEGDFLDASRTWARQIEAEGEAQQQRELEAARKLAEAERRRAEVQAVAARQLRQRAIILTGALIVAGLLAFVAVFLGQNASQSARRADALAGTAQAASTQAIAEQAVAEAERQRAERQARLAFARELAAAALSNLDLDPERSLLLAFQAVSVTYGVDETVTLEAENALHRAVQALRVLQTLPHPGGEVAAVDFSPLDGGTRLATASFDGTTRVWAVGPGGAQIELTLFGHTDRVTAVTFSSDGTRLATSSFDGTAKVWDVTTGQALLTLTGHTAEVVDVAFSPNGTRLATASWDETARLWDAATGQSLLTLSGHSNWLNSVAFSPVDGRLRLATSSDDGTAKVWDLESGRTLVTLTGHTNAVLDVAFSTDGALLATASFDGTAKVWDAAGELLLDLADHTGAVASVAFSPLEGGTRLATASWDGTAKVWLLPDNLGSGGAGVSGAGRAWLTLSGHAGSVVGVGFSPDGAQLATASWDSTAKVWDVRPEGSREWLTLAGHTDRVYRVIFSSLGGETRLVTASRDGTARVWQEDTGQLVLTLRGHAGPVRDIAASPDGMRLATAGQEGAVKLWDALTGRELQTLAGHADAVTAVAFSPADQGLHLATASDDGTAKVWDSATGQLLITLTGHADFLTDLAYSPDGSQLATASGDATVIVWDAETGRERVRLSGHSGPVRGVAFSPVGDGLRLATAGQDGTARLWALTAQGGQELISLTGHTGVVSEVVFSPDGTHLATASLDGTTKLWDAETGREWLTLFGHSNSVAGVAFSPVEDGAHLATASWDGTVRVYVLQIEELMTLAQMRLTRALTPEECQRFLHLRSGDCR